MSQTGKQPREGDVIRFTTDGSDPSAASAAYTPGNPIVLDDIASGGLANVRAAAFTSAGAQLGGITTTGWVARP
jgi:hypothetical protein